MNQVACNEIGQDQPKMLEYKDMVHNRISSALAHPGVKFHSLEYRRAFPLAHWDLNLLMTNNATYLPDPIEHPMAYETRMQRAKAFPYPSWDTRVDRWTYLAGKYDKKNVFKP